MQTKVLVRILKNKGVNLIISKNAWEFLEGAKSNTLVQKDAYIHEQYSCDNLLVKSNEIFSSHPHPTFQRKVETKLYSWYLVDHDSWPFNKRLTLLSNIDLKITRTFRKRTIDFELNCNWNKIRNSNLKLIMISTYVLHELYL